MIRRILVLVDPIGQGNDAWIARDADRATDSGGATYRRLGRKRPTSRDNLRLSSLLLILGGLLLAVGATLGYTPLTEGGVICGSAMSPDTKDAYVADLVDSFSNKVTTRKEACVDATASRKSIAQALLIPGGLLTAAGVVAFARDRSTTQTAKAAAVAAGNSAAKDATLT